MQALQKTPRTSSSLALPINAAIAPIQSEQKEAARKQHM
jgi:hypothetical protein